MKKKYLIYRDPGTQTAETEEQAPEIQEAGNGEGGGDEPAAGNGDLVD